MTGVGDKFMNMIAKSKRFIKQIQAVIGKMRVKIFRLYARRFFWANFVYGHSILCWQGLVGGRIYLIIYARLKRARLLARRACGNIVENMGKRGGYFSRPRRAYGRNNRFARRIERELRMTRRYAIIKRAVARRAPRPKEREL